MIGAADVSVTACSTSARTSEAADAVAIIASASRRTAGLPAGLDGSIE